MAICLKKERTSFSQIALGKCTGLRGGWQQALVSEKTKNPSGRGTLEKQTQFWRCDFFFTNHISCLGAKCYFLSHSKEMKKGCKAWGGRECFDFGGVFFWIMEIYVETRVCRCRTTLWWAAGWSCTAPEAGQFVCKGHRLPREAQTCTTSLQDDESFPLRPASFSEFRFLPLFHSHRSIPSRRTGSLYRQSLKGQQMLLVHVQKQLYWKDFEASFNPQPSPGLSLLTAEMAINTKWRWVTNCKGGFPGTNRYEEPFLLKQ